MADLGLNLTEAGIAAVVLGIMQDAGLPHVGCRCPRCTAAFLDPTLSEYVTSLALVDTVSQPNRVWLIDASPDIRYQFDMLGTILGSHPTQSGRLRQPDGIFITHGHMGHTAGLPQLGPEGMNVKNLPLFASERLIEVFRTSRLWKPLLDNLVFSVLRPKDPIKLGPNLSLIPVSVPHRDEVGTGTFGFICKGPERSLLYLPDIDSWTVWPEAKDVLTGVDLALVDATFFSPDELGGRAPVAHPLITETIELAAQFPNQFILTHLNHTNPALDPNSPARAIVESAGLMLAYTGQILPL